MTDSINIMIASDDKYICHATITIMSLLEHTKDTIKVFFLDEGISSENRIYLKRFIEDRGSEIEFLKVNKQDFINYPLGSHFQPAIYYRIIGPLLLPPTVEKVLYLDSDLLVLSDIKKLYNENLYGKTLGAVLEVPNDLTRLNKWGIKSNKYFNSGILLIDLNRWKSQNITMKTIEFLNENGQDLLYGDQDALNIVLKDEWYSINKKWNVQTQFFYTKDYNEICTNPYIIHFTTDVKPWHIYSEHPYKKMYLDYRKNTIWGNIPLIHPVLFELLKSNERKLIIFGTGQHSERIVSNLPFEVYCFLDNDENKSGKEFMGKKIKRPAEILSTKSKDFVIVIASMYHKEISTQLRSYNLVDEEDFFIL